VDKSISLQTKYTLRVLEVDVDLTRSQLMKLHNEIKKALFLDTEEPVKNKVLGDLKTEINYDENINNHSLPMDTLYKIKYDHQVIDLSIVKSVESPYFHVHDYDENTGEWTYKCKFKDGDYLLFYFYNKEQAVGSRNALLRQMKRYGLLVK